jgi:hypothetical protein
VTGACAVKGGSLADATGSAAVVTGASPLRKLLTTPFSLRMSSLNRMIANNNKTEITAQAPRCFLPNFVAGAVSGVIGKGSGLA